MAPVSSLGTILNTLPVLVAHGAFFAMVYSTLKMFTERLDARVSRRIAQLLNDKKLGGFQLASWDPYLHFLAALFLFLFAAGAVEKALPNSLLFCATALFLGLSSPGGPSFCVLTFPSPSACPSSSPRCASPSGTGDCFGRSSNSTPVSVPAGD